MGCSISLAGKLVREGSKGIKIEFEKLLEGGHLITPIDEQIVYNQLNGSEKATWSLLLASGYLKVLAYEEYEENITEPKYELAITNYEVRLMFRQMVRGWFDRVYSDFDTTTRTEPEHFYHGFVFQGKEVYIGERNGN